MGQFFDYIVELFRTGQAIPLFAVCVVIILSLYLFGLILTMVFPVWRRYRSPHQ